MRVRGFMRDKIVIPVAELEGFDYRDVVDGFAVDSFDDYNCAKCPLFSQRPVADCKPCENYKGRAYLARKIKNSTGRVTHLSFPLGARSEIERRLGVKLSLKDQRDFSRRELKRPLKMIKGLYDGSPAPDGTTRINQIAVVEQWMQHLMGVIHASARAGKTVCAAAITCAVGMRTLIVTDRIDLLKQFRETFIGGERRVRMTDAKEERVIIISKMTDFLKPHDVALLSYQKMIRENGAANVLRYVKGRYGLLVVDECLPLSTLIHTLHGQIPLGEILKDPASHWVLSYNHEDGKYYFSRIKNVSRSTTTEMVTITYFKGDRRDAIVTKRGRFNSQALDGPSPAFDRLPGSLRLTPNHPVWVEEKQAYVDASEVNTGDLIRYGCYYTKNPLVRVATVSLNEVRREEVGNIELERFNNFFANGILTHNCHMASAGAYSKFLALLDIPWRLGLSATPRRKDGRYRLTDTVLGPVVVRTENVGLKPLIKVHETGLYGNMRVKVWHVVSKLWAEDDERNRQITRLVYSMLDAGHKAIIVPLDRVEHIDAVVERINRVAENRYKANGNEGPTMDALAFYGKTKNRDQVLREFDRDDSPFRVLVCMRSIIKQGVDLSKPSAVICPIPMSATAKDDAGAPLFSQLSYRASTALDGKRQPEVILMVDQLPYAIKMVEGLLREEIMPASDIRVGPKKCVYKVDASCYPYMGAYGRRLASEE